MHENNTVTVKRGEGRQNWPQNHNTVTFMVKMQNKLPNIGHVVQSFVTFPFQMVDQK